MAEAAVAALNAAHALTGAVGRPVGHGARLWRVPSPGCGTGLNRGVRAYPRERFARHARRAEAGARGAVGVCTAAQADAAIGRARTAAVFVRLAAIFETIDAAEGDALGGHTMTAVRQQTVAVERAVLVHGATLGARAATIFVRFAAVFDAVAAARRRTLAIDAASAGRCGTIGV